MRVQDHLWFVLLALCACGETSTTPGTPQSDSDSDLPCANEETSGHYTVASVARYGWGTITKDMVVNGGELMARRYWDNVSYTGLLTAEGRCRLLELESNIEAGETYGCPGCLDAPVCTIGVVSPEGESSTHRYE